MNRRYKVRLELEVDSEAELEAVKDGIFTFLDFHKDEPGMTFASTRKCERIVLRGWKEVKWAAVGAGNGPGASSSAAVTSHSTLKF